MPSRKRRPLSFAGVMTIVTLVLLIAIGGVVTWVNNTEDQAGPSPSSEIIDAKSGAIRIGQGPITISTYLDYMCASCGTFEQLYGPVLREEAETGTITLAVHPIAIKDPSSQGTRYSSRAASATYCVAVNDPANVAGFIERLFREQPADGTPGLTDRQLEDIASSSGSADSLECIREGKYMDYVKHQTRAAPTGDDGQVRTPTVLIDGRQISLEDFGEKLVELAR